MKRLTQLGIATSIVCASFAWSQDPPLFDPAVFAAPDIQLDSGIQNVPVMGDPVHEPSLEQSVSPDVLPPDGLEPTEMIEASPHPAVSGVPYEEVQQFHSGRCYLSEVGNATNSCRMNAPCHSPDCPYCYAAPTSRLARLKAYMQRTHWGYCNYFDERPLGESMYTTLTQQIHRGLEDSMMLYHYDFYPQGSQRAGELTPRGRVQLMKIIERMQDRPAQIRIQLTENQPGLNQNRRQHVVESLAFLGADLPSDLVVLAPVRHQGSAIEASPIYDNQLESVIKRGRTIQSADSTKFGGR